jgi:signal transduction histidine kinase/DNA-binding response OmpR family regulator
LWVGSKGYGLAVSSRPLTETAPNHTKIRFRRFVYNPDDTASISNNNIYSICQDKEGNIWVGTYGNGLNLVIDPWSDKTYFKRINQQNSNLSSNSVRHLMADSKGNLWIATIFGINLLKREDIQSGKYDFKIFVHNISDENSLIYNDVIHIYEDSGGNIWFGTFGGGVDMIGKSRGSEVIFKHYGHDIIQGYGIIFGILEDDFGKIWLSSENGLICLDPVTAKTEVYNTFNGLGFNNFSENTCYKLANGSLVFGGNGGFEVINSERIVRNMPHEQIELTRFLLFNREVPIAGKDSPLKKSISFSDEIKLKHNQSSFSIDYSSLDFLDPAKTEYSYKLDNFDESWNNVANQHRATYTNLSPGKYLFRVRSMERNGRSASVERLLSIWITPPWYKTLAAYTLFGAILVLIVISIFRIISRINSYKNALIIEKKVNDYKLQFFTNISHEIRTPLTLIIGPLEDILADKDITGRKKMQMEIMLKNARRMLRLTNQLLDFRKVQNNKMTLKIKKIDIVAFTREIFDSFLPLATHKGIECTFESEFDEHLIFADPNKLDIIIYNIISNALKFTCTGKKVSVKISKSESSESTDISITDEGPGIPQKNLADLFTRYTILNNSDLGGTGIGLALSRELAKLHGGNIMVESTVGKGSTFTIRLKEGSEHFKNQPDFYPEEPDNEEFKHQNETIEEFENEESLHPDTTDKNMVLVVEDNHEVLDYICQSLKSYFICIGARNGSEGLHLARTLNPDLIITDIKMPVMDGIEMTGVLKEDFNTSHIPVIMLTSKSEMTDQIKGIKTGAEAYITKPFSMEYLKTVAANLINQREKLIARFLKEKPSENAPDKINSKDEEFVARFVSCVEDNCANPVSIDVLAGECNVSRTVLYNKIKGLTGLSPIDFLRKIRLNMAARYIEKGYNVSEAAFRTGFTDVRYFSRLFRQQFDHLPSHHQAKS